MELNGHQGRLAVYTVLMGQVAELNPIVEDANIDYICFTDQDLPRNSGWELRRISPVMPEDLPRSSRHPKILPHLYLPEYEKSIYVDSSVELQQSPHILWRNLIPTEEILFGAIQHSFHTTLLEEIVRVSEFGFEANEVLNKTVNALLMEDNQILFTTPIWGGILARRHLNPKTSSVMEEWFSWVKDFSRRDQASLPLAVKRFLPEQVSLLRVDNFNSHFHIWPTRGYCKPSVYRVDAQPQIDWRQWIFGLPDDFVRILDALLGKSAEWNALLTERDSLLTERDSLLTERDSLLTERDSLSENVLHITRSLSWSVTRPLRVLGRILYLRKKFGKS